MSAVFKQVIIIFNPNSSGDAKTEAGALRRRLVAVRPDLEVVLRPTEYAGHATGIAHQAAHEFQNPLIVSVSGDGGYNEVINGVMRAAAEGRAAICAVAPAGNANDHARAVQPRALADMILADRIQSIDLLKVSIAPPHGGPARERYAHSYVGLGVTPLVAQALSTTPNRGALHEASTIARSLQRLTPVAIRRDGALEAYYSITCSIVPSMAKVFKISNRAKPDDGYFELVLISDKSKTKLLIKMVRGITKELGVHSVRQEYAFELEEAADMQFDGEVEKLPAGTRLEVSICPLALRTIADSR